MDHEEKGTNGEKREGGKVELEIHWEEAEGRFLGVFLRDRIFNFPFKSIHQGSFNPLSQKCYLHVGYCIVYL